MENKYKIRITGCGHCCVRYEILLLRKSSWTWRWTADKTSEPLLNVLCKDDNYYEQALKRTSISESYDMHSMFLSCLLVATHLCFLFVRIPSGHVTSIATFESVVLIGQ